MANRTRPVQAIKLLGLTEVYATTSDTEVDIVFIHGLYGDPRATWSSDASGTIWPVTLLGPFLQTENARILVYGYAAETESFTDGAPGDKIHNHAEQLVAELAANRRASRATEHPIIFVAHSFGGLVVKRALIYSSEINGKNTEHLRSVFVSTYGILFLGTPHRGLTSTTWRSRLKAICRATLPISCVNDKLQLIDTFKPNNDTLQNIDRQFIQLSRSLHIFNFHEGKRTALGEGMWEYIVDENSASPTMQDVERAVIQKDHIQMCRFEDSHEPGFLLVAEAIQRYTSEAEGTIGPRWKLEKANQLARRSVEADEILRASGSLRVSPHSGLGRSQKSMSIVESPAKKRTKRHHDLQQFAQKDNTNAQVSFCLNFSLANAPEIDYFVGRVNDLSSMESVLLPYVPAQQKIMVLHGLGGIGKSQLAIEYAKKNHRQYTSVLWLNAKTENLLQRSFESHRKRCDGHPFSEESFQGTQKEIAMADIVQEVKKWLNAPENDRWLLIFDNVDDPKIPDNKSATSFDIRSYFPEAYQGSIIITTRWKSLRIGHLQEVKKLSDVEESISLLERTSGRTLCQDHAIQDLCNKLDGLPLALATAGTFLGATSCSISDYLQHHKTSWRELQQESPRLLSYEEDTMYSTWNISYLHIRQEDEAAAKILELWGYLDNQKVWYDLIKSGIDKDAPEWLKKVAKTKLSFQVAFGRLQKHALIEGLIDSDGYSMHHCVHRWANTVLAPKNHDQNLALALTCVAGSIHDFEAAHTSNNSPLFAHAEICNKALKLWMIKDPPIPRYLRRSMAYYFTNISWLYSELWYHFVAEEMLLSAIKAYEELNIPTNSVTLSILDRLAGVYTMQGRLNEAESLFERVLASKKSILGPDDFSLVNTMNNMSILYTSQKRFSKAETLCKKVLDIKEAKLGRSDASTSYTARTLGLIYQDQGKMKEAEMTFQRAVSGLVPVHGKNHPSAVDAFYNLAQLYVDQNEWEKSELILQDMLASRKESKDEGDLSFVYLTYSLGFVYRAQAKLAMAALMFRRSLSAGEEVCGGDHPRLLSRLHELGVIYCAQGLLPEAEIMVERHLAVCEKAFGREHRLTVDIVHLLDVICLEQSKLEKAEAIRNRTVDFILGYHAFRKASEYGLTVALNSLLDKGLDVNARNAQGVNPLHIASSNGHHSVVEALLDRGADINSRDAQRRSALLVAFAGGHKAVVDILLSRDANLAATDAQGRNCLHHAAIQKKCAGLIQWLIVSHGFDPDLRDRDGWTPLHWAARKGYGDAINSLQDAGAISCLENIRQWSPLKIALYHHNQKAARILMETSTNPYIIDDGELELIHNSPLEYGFPWDHSRYECDGCSMTIYNSRFHCKDCDDFDFCFKCNNSSATTHPNHQFEELKKIEELIIQRERF